MKKIVFTQKKRLDQKVEYMTHSIFFSFSKCGVGDLEMVASMYMHEY
jgi:hypothetical protein